MEASPCPFKQWGWHDGGPNHWCKGGKNNRFLCENEYEYDYQCEYSKQVKKRKVPLSPSCADCKHYLTNPEDEPCRLCFGYTRFEKKRSK